MSSEICKVKGELSTVNGQNSGFSGFALHTCGIGIQIMQFSVTLTIQLSLVENFNCDTGF